MRRCSTLVALVLAAAVAATARAEIPNMTLNLGLSGGGHFVLDTWDIREYQDSNGTRAWVSPGHTAIVGGHVGFTPHPWVTLELGLALIPAPADDINLITEYQIDALIQPFSFDKFTPFLDVGGIYYHNWTADAWGMDADPAFHWGLGVRYLLLDWLALRGEARHVISDGLNTGLLPVTSNLEVMVGVDFFVWTLPGMGGGDLEPAEDVRDRDGDGVSDAADQCPDAAGPVESSGCPAASSEPATAEPSTAESAPASAPESAPGSW